MREDGRPFLKAKLLFLCDFMYDVADQIQSDGDAGVACKAEANADLSRDVSVVLSGFGGGAAAKQQSTILCFHLRGYWI